MFVGWVESEIDEATDEEPIYTTDFDKITGDRDFYAVFATEENNDESIFTVGKSGDFKIYALVDGENKYATAYDNGKLGSTSDENSAVTYTFTHKGENQYTIYNGSKYIAYGTSGTDLKTQSGEYLWHIAPATDGKGSWRITSVSTTNRAIIYRTGYDFKAYGTNNITTTDYYDIEIGSVPTTTYSGYVTTCEATTLVEIGNSGNTSVIEANNGKEVNVQVNRTFTADKLHTLCLPFDAPVDILGKGTKAYQLSGVRSLKDGTLTIDVTTCNTMYAGAPYLVIPAQDFDNGELIVDNVTMENVDVASVNNVVSNGEINVVFQGILDADGNQTNGTTHYYIGQDSYLYNGKVDILGLRSMFTITGLPAGMRARVAFGENSATGLDNITNGENTTIKVIENGQLIIIRDGIKYNAQGMRF